MAPKKNKNKNAKKKAAEAAAAKASADKEVADTQAKADAEDNAEADAQKKAAEELAAKEAAHQKAEAEAAAKKRDDELKATEAAHAAAKKADADAKAAADAEAAAAKAKAEEDAKAAALHAEHQRKLAAAAEKAAAAAAAAKAAEAEAKAAEAEADKDDDTGAGAAESVTVSDVKIAVASAGAAGASVGAAGAVSGAVNAAAAGPADELKALITAVRAAQDDAARALGQRWLKASGAAEKRSAANAPRYADLAAEKVADAYLERDLAAVADDVKAFVPQSAALKAFLRVDGAAVQRVLRAYVQKSNLFGYVSQSGLVPVVAFLLAFVSEEDAFWLLNTLVTDLRACADFYSPLPSAMNGFQIESYVLSELLPGAKRDNALQAVERVSKQWLCNLFLDAVALPVQIAIADAFFTPSKGAGTTDGLRGGDAALFRAAVAVVNAAVVADGASVDARVSAWNAAAAGLTLDAVLTALRAPITGGSDAHVRALRDEARKQLAAKWNESQQELATLAKGTAFTREQLKGFQSAFQRVYAGGNVQGITKPQFIAVIRGQLSSTLTGEVLERVFDLFDWDGSGFVDFKELMLVLSVLTAGDAKEKFQLIFSLYDKDNSGALEAPEVFAMARSILRMISDHSKPDGSHYAVRTPSRKLDADAGADGAADAKAGAKGGPTLQTLFAKLMAMDKNGDKKISFAEFFASIREEEDVLRAFAVYEKVDPLLDAKANDPALQAIKHQTDAPAPAAPAPKADAAPAPAKTGAAAAPAASPAPAKSAPARQDSGAAAAPAAAAVQPQNVPNPSTRADASTPLLSSKGKRNAQTISDSSETNAGCCSSCVIL